MREAAGRDILYLHFPKLNWNLGLGAQQAWGRGCKTKGKSELGVQAACQCEEGAEGIFGGGDGLVTDKEKPESEGLSWENLWGSSQLSRESLISNPFPEELTKKDFKGRLPPPTSEGRKECWPWSRPRH